jgi:hypothetical protein
LIVSTPRNAPATLCQQPPVGVEVQCFSPDPSTTQGEAMGGTAIAQELGAQSLGVLTFDHHIERSRMLVDRCWDGDLHMYEFQPTRSKQSIRYDFVYAMAAYGKAFLTPGCSSDPPTWLQIPIDWIKG